ncbi:hypothetical protein NCLIV_032880 [Neospora caninum Liverpool]|uniref:Tuftelin-interacting protein 11 n=1 Tax=Neospora caninum (strain Liverpool) TaxID=572307 RepID=F0VIE0_NEOCL|nr:hypothetical protein NCLIV_032880 [Neospora caninum Liverpool]CBZ53501.1 hypothetical protein NCLIV_032880 [Neospora caninum Liverpool]CEL67489.1 TPA: Tuftelin-interacting protein 11 [Neospora caninum Liverpool]|eukprot:XP_003883533.1 hypothetical protein NCLIV_032880 [Neospora caninum Liverpool]
MSGEPSGDRGAPSRSFSSSRRQARKEEQIYGIFAEEVEETSSHFLLGSSDEDSDLYASGKKGKTGAIKFVKGGVWTPTVDGASTKKSRAETTAADQPQKKKREKPASADPKPDGRDEPAVSLHDQLLNAQVLKEVLGDAYESSEEENEEAAEASNGEKAEDAQDSPASRPLEEGEDAREAKRRKLEAPEAAEKSDSSESSDSDAESDSDEAGGSARFKFSSAKQDTDGTKAGDRGPVTVEKNTWGFAKMEKTYGVGFKLLQKMGFKGGGLGRHGTGVANPLEVRVREKNRGLQDSGEKVGRASKGKGLTALDILLGKKRDEGREGISDEWKKGRGAGQAPSERRRRRLAQTASEIAAEGRLQVERAREKLAASSVRILDMTGPDVRIIQDKHELGETLRQHKRVADGAAAAAEDEDEFVLQGLEDGEARRSARVARDTPLRGLQLHLRHVILGVEEELRQVVREKKEQEAVLLRYTERGEPEQGDSREETGQERAANGRGASPDQVILASLQSAKVMAKRVEDVERQLRRLQEKLEDGRAGNESRGARKEEDDRARRRRKEREREERRRKERGRSGSRENGSERRARDSHEASEDRTGPRSEKSQRDKDARGASVARNDRWSDEERSRSRSRSGGDEGSGGRGASQSPRRRREPSSRSKPKRLLSPDPFGIDDVLELAKDLHARYPFEFRLLHVPALLTALLRPRLQRALRTWQPLSPSSPSASAGLSSDSDFSSRLPAAVGRLVAFYSTLQHQEAVEVHTFQRMLATAQGQDVSPSSHAADSGAQSWIVPLLSGRVEGSELQRQSQEKLSFRLTFDAHTAALRLRRLTVRASAQAYRLGLHALEHVLRLTVLEALRTALVNDWAPDDGESARLQAEGKSDPKGLGPSGDEKEASGASTGGGDARICVVTLVERWLGALPPETARCLVEDVVLQKLVQAVDLWNPVKAKTPIHVWLHPWLPHLTAHHLQLLSSPLRLKIGLALDAKWKASDRSAVNLLLPWANVFDSYSFAALLQRSVMPKLHDHLLNLPIRPDNQHMDPLHDVLVWVPLLPVEMLVNLFLTAFFPRWLQVLKVWINSTHADFTEILEWYSGWKEILPQSLVTHPRVQGVFVEALQLMNYASATLGLPVIPQPPCTGPAPQPPSAVSPFPHPPSGAAPPAPDSNPTGAAVFSAAAGSPYYLGQGVSSLGSGAQVAPEPVAPGPPSPAVASDGVAPSPPGPISSLEYLEGLAKEKGILFKPKVGRIEEGRQVYAYGRMNMYVKDKVIFVKGKAILHWTPVDIDELVKLAKGEKTSLDSASYSRKGK